MFNFIKYIFVIFADAVIVPITIIADGVVNTAELSGAKCGMFAALGFVVAGVILGFEHTAVPFAAVTAPILAGVVRGILHEHTPVWDWVDGKWFKGQNVVFIWTSDEPLFIDDITPFLLGDDDDEEEEQPFHLGCGDGGVEVDSSFTM